MDPITVITWGIACLVWLFFGCATAFVTSYLIAIFQQHRDEQRSKINSDMQSSREQKCVLHLKNLVVCHDCVIDFKKEARSDERNEIIEEIIKPERGQLLSVTATLVEMIKARGGSNG